MRSKGSGSIRKKQSSVGTTYWEGRISAGYDPGTGKRIVKTVYGKTQREVQQKLNDITHDLQHGEYKEPTRITIAEWMAEYIDVYCRNRLKPYTVKKYESDIKNHINPGIGSLKLQSLTSVHLQKFSNNMLHDGSSAKTVRNVLGLLHKAMDVAVRHGYITINPADRLEPIKVSKTDIKPLTDAEIPRFLAAIEDDLYRNAYAVQLFAGLRTGECLGLSWRQVDFEKGSLLIDQQLQRRDGAWIPVPFTKSNRPRRILLPSIAIDYLKDEQLRQMKARLKAGIFWQPSDLVFTGSGGDPIPQFTYYKHFKIIASSIGRPDARPHDLRHTAATVAIASGADIKSVQDLLGHSTAAFTLNVYAHTSEKMMADTANRVQDYYANIKK